MQDSSIKSYPVMESFLSIQGEGGHQGKTAHFIRLAGCDVGCPWCDVPESWEAADHETRTILELSKEVKESPAPFVVVTGGEPAMHNLTYLTEVIHEHKRKSHIETSGAYPLSGRWDWICVSPKRFKKPLDSVLVQAHEIKVVIAHRNDLRWAQKFADAGNEGTRYFLQPEWSVVDEVMPQILSFMNEHPKWELSLQIHKYIGLP